uniref:Uncharacterized protein n=1 Tax=Arcella intermedia TaxID=1963864 RepID=A0A6B2L0U5_9EUKA
MLKGARKVAKAVAVTLGPKGRNVVIGQSYGEPKITKDGVTVAKSIDLRDPTENLGAQLVKSVASKTNDQAGDGTTTATVLTMSIFEEGCEKVAGGLNPMDIWRGVSKAVDRCVKELQTLSKDVVTHEQIKQVATVSGNGDEEIGSLIADAMKKVGRDGAITVESGKTLQCEIEVVEGMKFDQGFLSPGFVTEKKNSSCELKNPYILITDQKINSARALLPVLEQTVAQNRPLLILSVDGVESEVLSMLVINRLQGLKVCAVKAPGYGDNRTNMLQDIAVLTGGTIVSQELGLKLEDVKLKHLGTAQTTTITQDSTIILGGGGDKEAIEERVEIIRATVERSDSQYDKDRAKDRLAKLAGGVAQIKVGGASEVEVNEKKDRVVDALNATKAAVAEGIVPGGGSALLYCSLALNDLKGDNFDQDVGIKIIQKAILAPIKTIAANAGVDGSIVVSKLLDPPSGKVDRNMGYNAQTGKFVDMFQEGIIDPTKVVRVALVDASSVAGLLTTTQCLVTDELEKDKKSSGATEPEF